MSGVECHGRFVMACEDMIAAIEEHLRETRYDMGLMEHVRLMVAYHMVREGLRFGRAASRLITGDTSVETYDQEINHDNH